MSRIRVLAVASEMSPLITTSVLAYAVGGLPAALAAEDVETRTLIPGYPEVLSKLRVGEKVHAFDDLFGGPAWIHAAQVKEVDVYALVAPHLYAREGGLYAGPDGVDYLDNALRFAALSWVGAQMARGLVAGFRPDILHTYDWQAGLAPAYLHFSEGDRPATVHTVHMITDQGRFPRETLADLRLPPESFCADGVEHAGEINFLKTGLAFADRVATVSPSHARDIETAECGAGLDALLRNRGDCVGILLGVDESVWNPARDPRIAMRYDHFGFAMRAKNKSELQRRLRLRPDPEAFLVGVVARLSAQKGHDLLLAALPGFLGEDVQFALMGTGDPESEKGFVALREAHPGRVAVEIGFNEDMAHLMQAGLDAFIVPSRVEPCGLTQQYALRYGAVPVVSRVGGLRDTIIDANAMALRSGVATGLLFAPTAESLAAALRQAKKLFQDKGIWRQIQANGMKTDVSWRPAARQYAELYQEAVDSRSA